MKKILIFISLFTAFLGYSQKEWRVITTAVPFLMISSDARASGIGEQGVATSFDNFSQHWNPSKYVFSENSSGFGFSYTPYLSKIVNDVFLGNLTYYRKNSERSAWSFSLKYFSLGDIDVLQNPLDIPIIESPNEFTIDAGYSLKLNENFGLGITGRFLLSDVKLQSFDAESQAATSVAVDISGFFQSDIVKIGSGFEFLSDNSNSLTVSFEINKLLVPTPSIPIYDSSETEIIAYRQDDIGFLSGIFKSFGDAPDGSSEELKELTYSFGLEYSFNESFFLRSGYFSEHELKGSRKFITLGTGFKTNSNLSIDLSYLISTSEIISPLENTLRFSLSYNLF